MVRKVSLVAAILMALSLTPSLGRTNPGQPSAEGGVVVAAKSAAVRDNRNRAGAADDPAKAGASEESRLSEYIEMHGRATDYTGRASFMPWSALKQMAN